MYKQIGNLDIVLSSHQGKVRDIHDLGDKLLIVTSDRIPPSTWFSPILCRARA